ncbi:LegC family aminotransferase [Shewanella amazonensis]|uniref:Pyridoxal phosphate-dependent enzyme apparently involved in regulation of cell wall biogenesis n=1 Tax=Shewanella amazonensis (strain ATCC BAA-1098 / SB2B) TaxID=326297 RepID=A1S828_SHEAM|nr:LegC family aminotransferase [Shewanella amazonensis]ABM00535.1 pyridoxal phosphate-dependent enzyme apparently involved in regulation of cell wall biogenesis [Shewanella amazonensis SB2B]
MKPETLVEFVRDIYQSNEQIPLHVPSFDGNEKSYVLNCIDSTFVSSVGQYVNRFERQIADFTGCAGAVATVNGTAALHTALHLAGVERNDLVITQALTFVATANALFHMGAQPIFVDISPLSLGLCPKAVACYLQENAKLTEFGPVHKQTGQRIKAVVPMHTFGHPVELDELVSVCAKWQLTLVEDAAESLGSYYKGHHTGTVGKFGAISFNGNKIITTGGGGMLLCSDEQSALHAKHVTTTAKVPHPYEFYHDEPGFNYRMPNINAALGCAQMECLPQYLAQKRQLAHQYEALFASSDLKFVTEPAYAQSNYWLNAIVCADRQQRDQLLQFTNVAGVMTRPVWQLMHRLPMYQYSLRGELTNAEFFEARLINLPSTPVAEVVND